MNDPLVMAKPVGPACNLDCAYCYYLRKEALFPPGPRRMADDLLERYLAQRLARSSGPVTHFEWHGGEPTLFGLEGFRRIVALQKAHRPDGRRITNGLQTNGTLIDEPFADFLAEEGFSVGLSLDGPADLHDRYRRNQGGHGTHRQAMRALGLLRRRKVHVDVLCVVHAANASEPERVYRFFRDEGVRYLQWLPLVEPAPGAPRGVSTRTADPVAIGTFLCTIFDEWLRADLGRVVVQNFDEALRPAMGIDHALCIHRETCGDVVALEHDGSLYACDHFVDADHRLGTLAEEPFPALVDREELAAFGRRKRETLPRLCRECAVRAYCNGGCPKDRIATAPDGEAGLNYLCPAFRRFFSHVRPVMEQLAIHLEAGRPLEAFAPSRRSAEAAGGVRVGRNEPCPCGSGRKFKRCCLPGDATAG